MTIYESPSPNPDQVVLMAKRDDWTALLQRLPSDARGGEKMWIDRIRPLVTSALVGEGTTVRVTFTHADAVRILRHSR